MNICINIFGLNTFTIIINSIIPFVILCVRNDV